MEWQFVTTVAVFAAVMTGTPGPNNVMLTASGANFGYRQSIPHFVGIGIGLVTLIVFVAAGLGVVFQTYPVIQQGLKVLGCSYLLYLAWKIATAQPSEVTGSEQQSGPMSWHAAALFQFLNPKAWLMSITAVGSFTYSGDQYWLSVLVIAVTFMCVQMPCSSVWVGFGSFIRRWLSSPSSWRWFNGVMGGLTAACVAFIW